MHISKLPRPIIAAYLCASIAATPCFAGDANHNAAASNGTVQLENAMLKSHNEERIAVGVNPISWDATLARSAETYAKKMALSGKFQHDNQTSSKSPEGENLWMGTVGAYNFTEMAQSWADEKHYFKNGVFPAVSRSGEWSDVGHYTQMMWPETRYVGCAKASNVDYDFLVCRYFPAGNVMGRTLSKKM